MNKRLHESPLVRGTCGWARGKTEKTEISLGQPGSGRAEVTGACGPGDVITPALPTSPGLQRRRLLLCCCGDGVGGRGGVSGDPGPAQTVCGAVQSRRWPSAPVIDRQPAGLAAPARGERFRAMSRPSSVSPRPPAPGGGGGPAPCGPGGGGRAKGLKDIRIDEEVKIAVNIALERFRYGDQRGEVPDRDPAGCPASPKPGPTE